MVAGILCRTLLMVCVLVTLAMSANPPTVTLRDDRSMPLLPAYVSSSFQTQG